MKIYRKICICIGKFNSAEKRVTLIKHFPVDKG